MGLKLLIIMAAVLAGAGCGAGGGSAKAAPVPQAKPLDAQPGDAQIGVCDVEATGKNIMAEEPFDAVEVLGRVHQGMSPSDVVEALGLPKEVRCEGEPAKWFYTYEFPGKQGNDKWMILMVEFKGGVVSFSFRLPNG